MRKIIFTLMLAIAGSVWTMSSALCIARAPQSLQQPTTLSGLLVMEGTPCESTDTLYPCLPCLTLAFQSNETLYYLTSDNEQTMSQLDEIEAQLNESQHATVTGILYQQGSYNYINVQNISLNNDHLPSLCDQWNVLHEPFSIPDWISTFIYSLTTDTLIQNVRYIKLMEQEGTYTYYKGAMREGTNRDIYYVPANSTNEYLIYAFNAQVGDTLTHLWIGGVYYECPNGYNGIVQAISDGTPRKFTIAIDIDDEEDPFYTVPRRTEWIEGVGFLDNPTGPLFYLGAAVDYGVETILCAYKNGEQVYTSAKGEQYGCEYSEFVMPKMVRIPLYMLRGEESIPASVEPIESQIFAYIQYDYNLMMITDDSNEKISYTLTKYEPNASSVKKSGTFTHLGSANLNEYGHYMLRMKDQAWNYYACGWFHYTEQGTEVISLPLSSDSIPLFAQDNPGSSTVDPIDPNQVVATLEEDQLTINEYMGTTMTCTLNNESGNNMPIRRNAPQSQVFSDEVTVQITESGQYKLQLTNPLWGYSIVGRFNYVAEGIYNIRPSDAGVQKELRDGQLLIRRGDKIYTITGQQIQ